MTDRKTTGERRADREELAFLLPFFGTLLLVPPLVNLVIGKRMLLFGIPLESLYLFGVWLLIIIGTRILYWCRPFRDAYESPEEPRADRPELSRDTGAETGAAFDID